MGPIVVHHLVQSRSQRVLFLLEELRLPYTVRIYPRDAKTSLAPASLRAVHPLGKAPVLTDGDVTVAESGAIIEYIVESYDVHGELTPPPTATEARRKYRYWMHYAEGSAAVPLLFSLVFNTLERTAPKEVRETAVALSTGVKMSFVHPNVHTQLAFMDDALAREGPWFCGSKFTAADVQLSFVVEMAEGLGFLEDHAYPHLEDFLVRIRDRPAYRRAAATHGGFLVPRAARL